MAKRRRSQPFLFLLALIALAVGWYIQRQWSRDSRTDTGTGDGVTIEQTERAGSEDGTSSDLPLPESIQVFFSNAYGNDPSIGEEDETNIDRNLSRFIAGAERELDCAIFELESPRIAEALIAARHRGVLVRIVAESDYLDNEEMEAVAAAGIPVVGDERSGLMHNKFFVVDGKAVWTGSYNVTDNGAWRNNNNALLIRSPQLAENDRTEFDEMFLRKEFGPRSPSNTPHTLVKLSGADIYNYFSPEDEVSEKILRFVKAAKSRIRFLAFSMTDDALGDLIVWKYQQGIDVAGVLESRGSGLKHSELEKFRKAGINVRTDANKYAMHHKVIVVDGIWSIVGSFNFSANAAESNDENLLIIKSPAVARRFEEEYDRVSGIAE